MERKSMANVLDSLLFQSQYPLTGQYRIIEELKLQAVISLSVPYSGQKGQYRGLCYWFSGVGWRYGVRHPKNGGIRIASEVLRDTDRDLKTETQDDSISVLGSSTLPALVLLLRDVPRKYVESFLPISRGNTGNYNRNIRPYEALMSVHPQLSASIAIVPSSLGIIVPSTLPSPLISLAQRYIPIPPRDSSAAISLNVSCWSIGRRKRA